VQELVGNRSEVSPAPS